MTFAQPAFDSYSFVRPTRSCAQGTKLDMSLASALDSSSLNCADMVASPPKTRPLEPLSANPRTIALPTGREIGLAPMRPTAVATKPTYEPKQWRGVSAFYSDEAGDSPKFATSPTRNDEHVGEETSVSLPSARDIGLVPRPAASKTQYEVKVWTGISSLMSEEGDVYPSHSPENQRRRATSVDEGACNQASTKQSHGPGEVGAYPVNEAIKIPGSLELQATRGQAPARRHSLPGPSPRGDDSSKKSSLPSWLGGSSFSGFAASEHGFDGQNNSPSPPVRRRGGASNTTSKSSGAATDSAPTISIPSTSELNLGSASYRPRGRSRSVSYESHEQMASPPKWSGAALDGSNPNVPSNMHPLCPRDEP